MSELLRSLQELLNKFERGDERVSETAVYDAIRRLRTDEPVEAFTDLPLPYRAESMAFAFCPDYRDDQTSWGTYYGPMFVSCDDDGNRYDSPSVEMVDLSVLKYWVERVDEATHPILRARYADLTWDLGSRVAGFRPDVSMAHGVIDDSIRISEARLHKYDRATVIILERAVSLAISIRDQVRLDLASRAMIAFEDVLSEDAKSNDWGFSFKNLVMNKKSDLADAQKNKVVTDLEARLCNFVASSDEVGPSLSDAEHAAQLLARYYQRENFPGDVKRVLRLYGQAVVSASEKAGGLVGSGLLQRLFELYYANGMKDEANALTDRMRELGKQSRSEMYEISQTVEISKEELDNYLAEILEGGLEEVLERVAAQFIPNSSRNMKEIRELAKVAPFQFLVTRTIQGPEGRAVAEIGPLEEDPTGHLVSHTSTHMQFVSVFLRMVFERLVEDGLLSTDGLVEYLLTSAILDEGQRDVLEVGVQSYLDGEYLVSAHVLVPQIERALRTLLRLAGGATFKPDRNGGLSLRTLNEILRSDQVTQVLGEDTVLYLQVLLVDQRGWNLRNEICHGIQEPNSFGPRIGDRLIHVLLVLAQVHEQ